jgi:hypothetical protein
MPRSVALDEYRFRENGAQFMTFVRNLAAAVALCLVAAPALTHPVGQAASGPTISVTQIEGARFELVFAGERFTSRDAVEAKMLLRAAELARSRGADWFTLAQMPDEQPGDHPARSDISYGPQYAQWQPHWYYFVRGYGWQPWHPEWAVRFWADEIDVKTVERFEVHAMVELGSGPLPAVAEAFEARAVIADLQPKLVAGLPAEPRE